MIKFRRKFFEKFLERVPSYLRPKIRYEQYLTPSWLAADLLWIAELTFGDLSNKLVIDLGCGTGRLCIGIALLNAKFVIGIDIDVDALIQAVNFTRNNMNDYNIDYVCCDVNNLPFRENLKFDTVVQNPPFGVHREGYDILFLKAALRIGKVIYTIHKSSTREFIYKFLMENFKCEVRKIMTTVIPIPPVYPFHEKRIHKVEVDIFRIVVREKK